jgi:hypothetical protein
MKYFSKEEEEFYLLYPDGGFPDYYAEKLFCSFKSIGCNDY